MTLTAGTRLDADPNVSIHINHVAEITGPDGTPWRYVQAYCAPDPPPTICPYAKERGCPPEDYAANAQGWPVCAHCGYDSAPMARVAAGDAGVTKQPVYVPADASADDVAALVVKRAAIARQDAEHTAKLYARYLTEPGMLAVQVQRVTPLDPSHVAGGAALQRVEFTRLRASLDGVVTDALELLIAADATSEQIQAAMVAVVKSPPAEAPVSTGV